MRFRLFGIALVLILTACTGPKPAEPGVPLLQPQVIWDLLVEEPSALVALPDGTLLAAGDGDRGILYHITVKGDAIEVDPHWLDVRALRHLPHADYPGEAPDLEALTRTRDGRIGIASEYWNELWDVDLRLKAVTGLWRLPPVKSEGGLIECAGPSRNKGLEGAAFDPMRGEVLAAHERCPPALVWFGENSGAARRVWPRAELDKIFGSPVGSFSEISWAGRPGEYLAVDRLRREVLRLSLSAEGALSLQGRWSFTGIFRERGLHKEFGNVEGLAVTLDSLYLVTDPGEGHTAQLARFAWKP